MAVSRAKSSRFKKKKVKVKSGPQKGQVVVRHVLRDASKAKSKPKWIAGVTSTMKKGAFRDQARRAGYASTEKFAKHVLNNPSKYQAKTRRRAHLALNLMGSRK